ncbi:hypothetical protein AK830_g5458 [Neonectria ditissima]|uniref:Calcineurin-like phosphoesterase domain-containing protein n=1 Tax=Neonectria ditissima TaxID=78410 RepID=A0A0P7B408_9HYPO|nr:hypothetical protein AK830_g5458 [Neonectria ditissima]
MPANTVHSVVTDLTIRFCSPGDGDALFTPQLGSRVWHRVGKDLYLHSAPQTAWLHIAQTEEKELSSGDLVVIDVRVGETIPDEELDQAWEKRPGGIWVRRSKYSGDIQRAVTAVDVLFGVDAVDPRPQWTIVHSPLELPDVDPQVPVARLTTRHGKKRSKPDNSHKGLLRVRADGKFKILQISDTHMVTGVGVCNDAADVHGQPLPDSEADPLTVDFIGHKLDVEKADLVVLTGDQVHHDILDTQSALFKVAAPLIERKIPYAAVFGNHDSEGVYALSRSAQIEILQELPFSLSQSGPGKVDGIGNYYTQIFAREPSKKPLSTLYFLDSHGQIPSEVQNPDYDPIKQSQIDWFSHAAQELRKARKNKDDIFHTSIVFMHIPFLEFADDRLLVRGGHRREPTEGPSVNSHFYDALVKEGIQAVGCGHDHVNDFCGLLQHVDKKPAPWLCYGGGSGFGGYCSYGKNRYHRRMRIWELDTSEESLRTWKQVEYSDKRVDELVLVEKGVVVEPSDVGAGGFGAMPAEAEL